MKATVIPILFYVSGSLVAAGPLAIAGRVIKGAVTAGKAVAAVAGGNKKKSKRDLYYDADEFENMLVARDHSIQEWIDLVYNPHAGSGISTQITSLLAQLGRTPPPAGAQCPTKTDKIPQFTHAIPIEENKAIPRDQSIQMLTYMTTTPPQDAAKRVFFASLEVAFQLNCWTIPPDVKAIVDSKGWMQQIQGASPAGAGAGAAGAGGAGSAGAAGAQSLLQAPPSAAAAAPLAAAGGPAPRSIAEFDSDLEIRDPAIDGEFDVELLTREAEDDAEFEFDLWTRDVDEEMELFERDSFYGEY